MMTDEEKKYMGYFFRFLKEYDAYSKFMEYYNELSSIEWRNNWRRVEKEYYYYKDIVNDAFPWALKSQHEAQYWLNLDVKWKNKINDLELNGMMHFEFHL